MLKRMKKWKRATVLCIIISLILSLSACGGTQKPRENGTSVGEDSRETTSVQQSQEEGLETVEAVDSATASRRKLRRQQLLSELLKQVQLQLIQQNLRPKLQQMRPKQH